MACIYRYTDLADNIIKYIGIVWSDNRTLKQRLYEHSKNDEWCKNGNFKIEYIKVKSRTDAEFLEAHYISLYHTDKYYNDSKSEWGISSFVPYKESDWKEYNDNTYIEDYVGDFVSEEQMAETLVKQILLLKNDDEIASFGRKLRAKKNRHTVKSETEFIYWQNVICLINNKLRTALFGNDLPSDFVDVEFDGCWNINIQVQYLGKIIYKPYNNTYLIPSISKEAVNKDVLISRLQDFSTSITLFSSIINSNTTNLFGEKTYNNEKIALSMRDNCNLRSIENSLFDISKWSKHYKNFVETFANGVGISYTDCENPNRTHTLYVRNEDDSFQITSGSGVDLSKEHLELFIKMLIDKYDLDLD